MKLSAIVSRRHNGFDILRIIAASLVIFGHSYHIKGGYTPIHWPWGTGFGGGLGVIIFFVISGFLITKSFEQSSSLKSFLKKRILRIFPALILVILLTVFILGPIMTALSLTGYFSSGETWRYLLGIFLYPMQFHLPGVFRDNVGNMVNGSLWTLPVEWTMYMSITVICFFFRNKKIILGFLGVMIISAALTSILIPEEKMWGYLPPSRSARLGICFWFGAIAWFLSEKINIRWYYAGIGLSIVLASRYIPHGNLWCLPALAYLVFFLASMYHPMIKKFSKLGDPSYGMYIYSFPIQQTCITCFGGIAASIGAGTVFIISFLFSIMAGYISWHLLEKHALKSAY